MDSITVTLVAAIVAAGASLIVMLLTILHQRSSELRVARRAALDKIIVDLGALFHELLATCNVYTQARSPESEQKWIGKAFQARDRIKSIRPSVRYSLWGLDEGLRTLTRLPEWLEHKRADSEATKELLTAGDNLRKALDSAILGSYKHGRPPSLFERRRVCRRADQLRKAFGERPAMESDVQTEP